MGISTEATASENVAAATSTGAAFGHSPGLRPIVKLGPLPEHPLISVLVANFNYAAYIGPTIESVLAQTYANFELILCDDGSSDDSVAIMNRYAANDRRIRVLTRQNGGQAVALNSAFAANRGDIICTLDSDDLFAGSKLEKVVEAFRSNPECGAAIHFMRVIDSHGARRAGLVVTAEGYIGSEFVGLRVDNPYPPTSGISLRREVAERVFPIPESLRTYADHGISGAAALLTQSCLIREELADWRMHEGSLSGGAAAALSALDEAWLTKHLYGTELGLRANAEWARRELRFDLDYSTCRQYIEYRLALGIARGDRKLVRAAASDLRRAFRTARMGYPSHRYLFWLVLSYLPMHAARIAMQLGFNLYYRLRRAD
jgi:glycosyltransferase involved in cell wall biosynthesis